MTNTTQAISRVITKRLTRGAKKGEITLYIQHLKHVWRNSPEILAWLNSCWLN